LRNEFKGKKFEEEEVREGEKEDQKLLLNRAMGKKPHRLGRGQ